MLDSLFFIGYAMLDS